MNRITVRSRTGHRPPQLLNKYSPQPEIVYGPVQSRRLGISLGINLLPTAYKLCSFNCIYCQYGWTEDTTPASGGLDNLPTVDEVGTAVEKVLADLSRGKKTLDSITICGNGEPTVYPALTEIIVKMKELRDRYQPDACISILSNSSTLGEPSVRAALELIDVKIMKFDAGSEEMFCQLNHPTAPVYMGEIIVGLKALKNIYLQSCFIQGRVTNTDPESVSMWIQKIREIHPAGVQIYSLDREPPDKGIEKVSVITLQWIAGEVRWRTGVPAEVF